MKMKVTVCELNDEQDSFARDWEQLVSHVKAESSHLVLLPETPFYSYFPLTRPFSPTVWQAAIAAHDVWQARLQELTPAMVLTSRPVSAESRRLNEGFVWKPESGYRGVHIKYYLPDEEGFWEASWYHRGNGDFTPIQSSRVRIGFLICTELWFMERARAYGKDGVHIVATPRVTSKATVDKWLSGGRTAAVISGAFSLSSNRVSLEGQPANFGGQGWIIGPDGEVLGLTSQERPFVTVEIDLNEAERAKQTYPRYVLE